MTRGVWSQVQAEAEAMDAGHTLCYRDPRPDDDVLYSILPTYEDRLGNPVWVPGRTDRIVSRVEMERIRKKRGLV